MATLRLRVLAVTLAVLSLPATAAAQEGQPAGDGRRTIAQLPENLLRATVGVFSTDNLKPLFAGSVATGVAALFDDKVAEAIADPDEEFGKVVETGGGSAWSAAAVGAVFVTGRLVENPRFRAVSYDWLDACAVTAAYTGLLKVVVGRERPNGADKKSFPSGHTSNAFALAAVAERHYGWKVGVAAYGLAAAVGVARLQRNAHYLSDVMAGATIGYIVGRTVVRLNNRPAAPNRAQVGVSPVLGRRTRSIVVQVSF